MGIIILEHLILSVFTIGCCLYILYRIFYLKSFLPTEEEDKKNKVDPNIATWRNKHGKLFTGGILSVSIPMLILCIYLIVIPFGKDMKYIVGNKYPEVEGVIVNDMRENGGYKYGQTVIISNGKEEIEVHLTTDNLKKGDYIAVVYLPNSKVGVLCGRRN